jgi:hypothetical protein
VEQKNVSFDNSGSNRKANRHATNHRMIRNVIFIYKMIRVTLKVTGNSYEFDTNFKCF